MEWNTDSVVARREVLKWAGAALGGMMAGVSFPLKVTAQANTKPLGTARYAIFIQMTGAIAQYGRGMMQDVIGSLMKQFANCAAGEISRPGSGKAGGGAPKAMSGFSLMLISAKAFFKNLFKFGKKK